MMKSRGMGAVRPSKKKGNGAKRDKGLVPPSNNMPPVPPNKVKTR